MLNKESFGIDLRLTIHIVKVCYSAGLACTVSVPFWLQAGRPPQRLDTLQLREIDASA